MDCRLLSKSGILRAAAILLLAAVSCQGSLQPLAPPNSAVTPANHMKFPIQSGVHAVSCDTCHGNFASFSQFSCLNCHGHEQPLTDELHRSLVAVGAGMADGGTGYVYSSDSCLQCHATGARVAFDHAGVTSACASCHGTGAPFDPLPVSGVGLDGGVFVHPDKGGNDCQACHTIASWSGAANAPEGKSDPAQNVAIDAGIPSYGGTSIVNITLQTESLPMPMFHRSASVPTSLSCISCHLNANSGLFFPGRLHASLATQPATCIDCHATSVPSGFVGPAPIKPVRTPPSGEMKHDAVLWSNGAPTSTPAVPKECSTCHTAAAPPATPTWVTSQKFHASLAAAAQPSSCLDCHANTRPAALTSANAALPANVQFDHSIGSALGECATCHSAQYTAWSGGRFHLPSSATPSTCLPCHSSERPTSTVGWDPSHTISPFDYVHDSNGLATHGAGQDCAVCHGGPGTGAWGGTQNWKGGHFSHDAATTVAGTTCIACHSTQRPDLNGVTPAQIPYNGVPFDHSTNGTGDCYGCHSQATVPRGSYVHYLPIPGDWQGGVGYPGKTLISAPTQFITVPETTLNPAPPSLVTGSSTISATLHNAMLHDDFTVLNPLGLYPGPANSPDYTKCYRCHTSTNVATGAPYANGQFHTILSAPQQPTMYCSDCHSQMRPTGIVFKSGLELQPMDHNAAFASAATVISNGTPTSVTNVNQIDCSTCHKSPGGAWSDGTFHQRIGAAVPADCTVCHYTLMADSTAADLTSGTSYGMRHKSTQLKFQNCRSCHTTALSNGAVTPISAALWRPGAFHAGVGTQPLACNDCHTISEPAAGASTRSSVTYNLALGGTSSNAAQWMNHGSPSVVGKDCATCHQADAVASGAAWSKSDSFHKAVASPASCRECHGLTNGGGSVAGTNNNLPAGLTNSTTVTSAASDSTTGLPAGTFDQITHADINVSSHDCSFCHTQKGVSTVAGVQGKEWAQASFHASFNAGNTLVMNGTTGRCSDCHMNVKPAASFPLFNHSGLSATSGSQDCASCHAWPGTGTASSPNWLGAASVPQYLTVGGFIIPQPPASSTTTQSGIANLPHPPVPTGVACTTCHLSASGGKPATGYDHASTLITNNCSSCHEAGSNLVGTPWNGATTQAAGLGDTRPFTTPLSQCNIPATALHFYPPSGTSASLGDCSLCHKTPAGNGTTTTGAAYTSAWRWSHPPKTGSKSNFPCLVCHVQQNCGN